MIHLLTGFERLDGKSLSDDERETITNNIGVLTEISTDLIGLATEYCLSDDQGITAANLCHAAQFISEIVNNLNGLLQK